MGWTKLEVIHCEVATIRLGDPPSVVGDDTKKKSNWEIENPSGLSGLAFFA